MKKKLKFIPLSIFVLVLLALVWTNTGNHPESGYTYCGGGGFIPKSSLPSGRGVYNGMCLGESVTHTISGRYINTNVLNVGLAVIGLLSVASYLVLLSKDRRAKTK